MRSYIGTRSAKKKKKLFDFEKILLLEDMKQACNAEVSKEQMTVAELRKLCINPI